MPLRSSPAAGGGHRRRLVPDGRPVSGRDLLLRVVPPHPPRHGPPRARRGRIGMLSPHGLSGNKDGRGHRASEGSTASQLISFDAVKFSKDWRSILPAGDTSQFMSSSVADIAILEEPEHLNWYHHGRRSTDKFNHVVGIVHTNYLEYIKREKNGALQAFPR